MILDNKLIKYVVFKKRTENEVRQKCKNLNYTDDYIDEIVDYLKDAEFINDEVYVKKYIDNIKRLKKSSVCEIKYDLLKKGVKEDLFESYINEELYEYECNSAIELANKKYKNGDDIEKIKKYLMTKGYQYNSINNAIKNLKEYQI